MNLRLNYVLSRSRANGPGLRYTIWVQGCSIRCPGCSNIDTWDPAGGYEIGVYELLDMIRQEKAKGFLDGITITGGEPLDQYPSIYYLCGSLFGLINIFLTTGYTMRQLIQSKSWGINEVVDILCVGPFDKNKICSGEWKGSSNQILLYLTESGEQQSLMPVIKKEYCIKPGQVIKTGFTQ